MTTAEAPGRSLNVQAKDMKWFWSGAFVIVALFGYGMTQWEVIEHLAENEGVGEEGANLLAFAAGYTLPLTIGFLVVALVYLRGAMNDWNPYGTALFVGGVLFVAGLLAAEVGLGLLPSYDLAPPEGGHPILRLLVWVLKGYFNTYGWGLMLSALALGICSAIQIDVWLRDSESPQPN